MLLLHGGRKTHVLHSLLHRRLLLLLLLLKR